MDVKNPLSSNSPTDHELVRRAVEQSDQSAYAELLERYRDSIFFLLLKMVNNKDDAEDLTIETFGKAFRNLSNYQPTFAFSTWLYRIATNNGIDFLRKKKLPTFSIDNPLKNKDGEAFEINISGDTPDPEETIIKQQKKESLRLFVDKLKPRYKQLIELRYYEDLSYEEIASKLQLPLGTVKAQLFRAKELLYHIISKTKGRL
ncbi:MAG: sigma-70 family RNA polymerase sigma factor [Flavobacteriales bacterium]|nr:sigma-70 family RNA polymerase sigma factor [Flavobacteriales bacterium]